MSFTPINSYHNNVAMQRNYYSSKPSKKQAGVAIASAFIPGLGQAINNEWGKGALFLGGQIATALLTRSCDKRGATVPALIFALANAIVRGYSTADAVLNVRA